MDSRWSFTPYLIRGRNDRETYRNVIVFCLNSYMYKRYAEVSAVNAFVWFIHKPSLMVK